jgi:hypothetical protein
MSKSTHHSFDIQLATEYGIEEAIIIHHFQHWINHNKTLGKNFINGRTWSYQTRKEIAAWFPYLTEKQVRTITDNLEEKGVLIKGNFNKKGFDKTIWYAFKNEKMFTIAQTGNGAAQTGKPIPDTKTDTKTKEEVVSKKGTTTFSKFSKEIRDRLVNEIGFGEKDLASLKKYNFPQEKVCLALDHAKRTDCLKTVGWFVSCIKKEYWKDKSKESVIEANREAVTNKYGEMNGKTREGHEITITDNHIKFECYPLIKTFYFKEVNVLERINSFLHGRGVYKKMFRNV